MTRKHLSRVEFTDFRTFGRFRLDVAPGPGLTLVVGPNGLGKSSFFDGIEWCLTGRIRRFADYVGRLGERDYLTRRDAETPDSHAVSLGFDTGEPITRSGTESPDPERLVEALKTIGWGEIKDLAAYLNFTHFLGQAAQQRFTSRSKGDQWEALKGPSGIDRLEQMRLALRSPATTAAFRRRLAQQAAEIEVAEQALARWRDDSARLAALSASARASGSPSAEAIVRDIKALGSSAETLGLSIAAAARAAEPTGTLIGLRAALDDGRARALDGQRQLERLRLLAARHEVLAAGADPDGTGATAARQAVDGATAELTRASLTSRGVEKRVAAQAGAIATAEEALRRSIGVANTVEAATQLGTTVERLVERRDALAASLGMTESACVDTANALVAGRARQVARLALQERRDVDEGVVERANRLATLDAATRAAETRATRARKDASAAATAGETLRARFAELRAALTKAEADLATARRRASEMADALAAVARHIGEHDERCPVCATAFPVGALKSLADAAARGQDEELTRRAQAAETVRRAFEEATATLAATEESGALADAARAEADAAAKALAQARHEVATLLGIDADDDLAATAGQRLAATAAALAEVEAGIALADASLSELEAAAKDAERAHAAIRAERDEIGRDIAAAEKRRVELSAALADEPDAVKPGALAARIDGGRKALAKVEALHSAAQIALAAAVATETIARQRLDTVEAARAQTEKAVAGARSERTALAAEWSAAGLAGEPTGRGAAEHGDALAQRLAALNGLLAEVDRVTRALGEVAAESELRTLMERLTEEAGEAAARDPSTHERTLLSGLNQARSAHRATVETQAAVNAYTVQLKERADRFSAEFLMPLNGLIDDFNRTLLSTPGETVQFSADAAVNRTTFGMQLRYADEVDNSRYNTGLPPQLVLSEGQMAANGFSILCAASVAYPWSNWRALLLDDPLQHNDIIHAAAFADVMRNLVEHQGYQLLMSSHDRAEGEFLFRKFDAAGLPCTMVTLTAPSRLGVISEPPRHNAAASSLLAKPLAAAG